MKTFNKLIFSTVLCCFGLISNNLNAQIGMDLDEAIKLGTTTATDNGLIRYTGSDFEGRTGGSWVSLTGGGGSSPWTVNGSGVRHSKAGSCWVQAESSSSNSVAFQMLRSGAQEAIIWHEDSSGDLIFTNNNGSTRHMVIDGATKYVGINDNAPDQQLTVKTTGTNGIKIEGNDTGDARLWITNGTGASHFIFDDDSDSHALKFQASDDMDFMTGGTNNRMSIDGVTGQVRIDETLRVDGESTLTGSISTSSDFKFTGSSDPKLIFRNQSPPADGAEIYFDYDGTQVPPNAGGNAGDLVLRNTRVVGDIEFYVNNTDKLLRLSSAQIVESLGERLDVRHNAGTLSKGLRIHNTVNSNWWQFYASSSSNNMSVVNSANGIVGTFSSTGVYTASDSRLKENIKDLNYGLKDILAMSPKSYNYIKSKDEPTIGFLAQEVKSIVPELVLYDQENDLHLINYAGMSVVAVKAIQEQQQQIDVLKQENAEMKAQIAEILKALDK